MDIRKAIRQARLDNQTGLNIDIPRGSKTEIALILSMERQGSISFIDPREKKRFEVLSKRPDWALGGKLSASLRLNPVAREHVVSAVLHGAHAKVLAIKIR